MRGVLWGFCHVFKALTASFSDFRLAVSGLATHIDPTCLKPGNRRATHSEKALQVAPSTCSSSLQGWR